jgi:hypothetical protein
MPQETTLSSTGRGVIQANTMEDIPQPADEHYQEGDRVRIYLSESDADSEYHGVVCEVIGIDVDDLSRLTDREIDSYQYHLSRVDTGEELPITFRHTDLVPDVQK